MPAALPARFADEAFGFYGRILGGQQEQQPRWKRVLAGAGADIGESVAKCFVAETFPPEAKDRCEQMIGHLVAAMHRSIEGLPWMTDATRTEALRKLAGFGAKIGYPDTWKDDAPIGIDRSSWAGNRIRANRFELARLFARLDEPVDRTEWAIPAHVVNAYYHPLLNEIVFPAGILRPPFFYADADDAVNYGGIGTVIGHEIDARLRRPGQPLRRHRPQAGLVDGGRPRGVRAADDATRGTVRPVRGRRRREGQRQADAGREHRRPGRRGDRARRPA